MMETVLLLIGAVLGQLWFAVVRYAGRRLRTNSQHSKRTREWMRQQGIKPPTDKKFAEAKKLARFLK